MKKIFFALCSLSTYSYATELTSYNEIFQKVSQGQEIRLIINLEACNLKHMADMLVSTIPQSMMIRSKYIQFSNSPMTTNHPGFVGKPVLENVTYRLRNSGDLDITMRSFALPDYAFIDESKVTCAQKSGFRVFSQSSVKINELSF